MRHRVAGWGSRLGPGLEKSPTTALERFLLSLGVWDGQVLSLTSRFSYGASLDYMDRPALWTFYGIFCVGGTARAGARCRARMRDRHCSGFLLGQRFAGFTAELACHWSDMALALVMAFVPELFYDSLVYHVGLPQMYINEGRFVDTPNVYFSRFPRCSSAYAGNVLGVGLDGSTMAKLF